MFESACKLGFKVKLTHERYLHIILRHPEILDKENEIKEALENPDFIKESKHDNTVLLFYKSSNKEYIVVVVKRVEKAFVLTAYATDFIKEGDMIWKR